MAEGDPEAEVHPLGRAPLDRAAFERIVRAHQAAVVAYCVRGLADPATARDLAQEVFLTLWRERHRYTDPGLARAYLIGIARHRCLAEGKRAKARAQLVAAAEAQPAPPSADPSAMAGARSKLEAALGAIDPERAEVLRLRYVDELTPTEIAAVLELNVGTVKSRLFRGLAELREEMSRAR